MRVPRGRFAPIRTPIGSAPANATMQLLHQTCRSRIVRLKAAGVIAGSPGKYGAQQRFNASTSSATSSERQNRYALKLSVLAHRQRSHLVEIRAAGALVIGRDHFGHHLLADLDPVLDEREVD